MDGTSSVKLFLLKSRYKTIGTLLKAVIIYCTSLSPKLIPLKFNFGFKYPLFVEEIRVESSYHKYIKIKFSSNINRN